MVCVLCMRDTLHSVRIDANRESERTYKIVENLFIIAALAESITMIIIEAN